MVQSEKLNKYGGRDIEEKKSLTLAPVVDIMTWLCPRETKVSADCDCDYQRK